MIGVFTIKNHMNIVLEKICKFIAFWSSLLLTGVVLCGLFVLPVFIYFSKDLPDYNQLTEYSPPTISRIYSADGALMAELAHERRIFRKISEIPQVVKNAFIAVEDQNYYSHSGIDVISISRAAIQNIMNLGSERNPVGGSTITQQVVKNFLLNNERSISRKIKEAILAYRINKVYTKDRILELYLNQTYLGNGSYGVTQAALSYFNKDLKDVTIEEAALLAAMPKAPSSLDPTRHPEKAKARRDYVIDRMLEEKYVTDAQAQKAKSTPLNLSTRFDHAILDNGYYTETTRLELIDKYGHESAYQDGYSVHTNLDRRLQKFADEALRSGLIEYDRRHGWKGPLKNEKFKGDEWKAIIKAFVKPEASGTWKPAIVIAAQADSASVGFKDGSKGSIPLTNMLWARKRLAEQYVGKKIEAATDVLKVGDIILVGTNPQNNTLTLEQIPDANGALVAMQPKTGKVLALVGGYSFKESKYNRVTQAMRQPGSAFKPLVFLAALEANYPPNLIIKDEPVAISQGPGLPMWTPKNIEGKFLGPITMRRALEKSRNLATVRLLTSIGINPVAELSTRLNVYRNPPHMYSMALGAYETTLLNITTAFATFASNGAEVKPHIIDRVFDRDGKIIYSADNAKCEGCTTLDEEALPKLAYETKYLIDPRTNYQLVSILEGVVERGTGQRAKQLNKTLAGKTGTSNDSNDTWFIGFSPDLVCGIYVGYDNPRTLGKKEQGATLALPIFVNFMKQAISEMPNKEFYPPEGISFAELDGDTGKRAGTFTRKPVLEAFKLEQLTALADDDTMELQENSNVLKDVDAPNTEEEDD